MFTVPIDQLLQFINYVAVILGLLMVPSLFISVLWAVRFFIASIVVGLCVYLVITTGSISCLCHIQHDTNVSCQRERTLVYELFKQETSLNSLNAVKVHRKVRIGIEPEDKIQLQLVDSNKRYLLHPAHQFSRLERVMDSKNKLYSIDEVLQDLQDFKLGDAGNIRHYRDRIGILGSLRSVVSVLISLPIILSIWAMSEYYFGELGRASERSSSEESPK